MNSPAQFVKLSDEQLYQGARLLFHYLEDFLYVKDGLGRWIYANPTALKVFQLSDFTYCGKDDSELGLFNPYFQKVCSHSKSIDEHVWEAGEVVRGEETILQLDGTVRSFDTIKIPTFCEDGSRNTLLVLGRDVTAHRWAINEALNKNSYPFFSVELETKIHEQRSVETALRDAIKNQQFTLFYQPTVDAASHITGAEALIRCKSPRLKNVLPSEFIAVAEETGLIMPLGEWVLRTACHQAHDWYAQGYRDLRISVNISPRQFRDQSFLEKFRSVLQETGANTEWIGVEITEGTVVDDINYAEETLNGLREMGITVSIDDFGTGFSSLSRLKRLPIDRIKIDRSFVDQITKDGPDEAIVKAIIQLAADLGISAIAEGVETNEQLNVLSSNGCTEFQGYFFGRPVPKDEFVSYLDAERAEGR